MPGKLVTEEIYNFALKASARKMYIASQSFVVKISLRDNRLSTHYMILTIPLTMVDIPNPIFSRIQLRWCTDPASHTIGG